MTRGVSRECVCVELRPDLVRPGACPKPCSCSLVHVNLRGSTNQTLGSFKQVFMFMCLFNFACSMQQRDTACHDHSHPRSSNAPNGCASARLWNYPGPVLLWARRVLQVTLTKMWVSPMERGSGMLAQFDTVQVAGVTLGMG